MDGNDKIYTWRELPHPSENRKTKIVWQWGGWYHAANDRNHILESEQLWRSAYDRSTISPVLDAMNFNSFDSCRSAFARLCASWQIDFKRTFSLPRVLQSTVFNNAASKRLRQAFMFTIPTGVIFVASSPKNSTSIFFLATFYFPSRRVSKNFATGSEHAAIEQIYLTYTRNSGHRLPEPRNPNHEVRRKKECDREIRFVNAINWGFASETPGAKWLGVPQELKQSRLELEADYPIPPPPTKNIDDDQDGS